jgi:RND family efflux transporter MFP subunit
MLSITLLLAACGQQEAPPATSTTETSGTAGTTARFSLAPLAEVLIQPERSAPAAVIGKHETRISSEVAATILALPAEVGQTLRQHEVLLRLDPRDAELALERAAAALEQARARHALARAQHERTRRLREQNFVSAEALALRDSELAVAAADLRVATTLRDTARRALDKHTLRAPFNAVVRTRHGQLGELAAPGAVLLTLVATDERELTAQLQPDDALAFAAAVPPTPTFVAGGTAHVLKLLRVSPALSRESRSVEARFTFVDTPPAVGLEGRLLWHDTRGWLSADLLVRRNGRYGVFVAHDGTAVFQPLPDAQEGRPARIDLPPDTPIVIQGRHALQDGAALR